MDKMDCRQVLDALPLLLYKELDPKKIQSITSHLKSCATCGAEWDALNKVTGLLDQWPDVKQPFDPGRMFRPAAERFSRFRNPLWIAAAAAALFLVFTLLFMGIEVRALEGGVVVTFGQPIIENDKTSPRLKDLENNMDLLAAVVVRKFEDLNETLEKKRDDLVQTIRVQQEKDRLWSSRMIQRVAEKSQKHQNQTMVLLEGLADLFYRDASEQWGTH